MIKLWGVVVLGLLVCFYLGTLLLSSIRESDDKYIVAILKAGYKTFDYFNMKKNSLGVHISYIILGIGYIILNRKKPKLKKGQ